MMPVRNSGDPGHCDWQPAGGGGFVCAKCGSKTSIISTALCQNEWQPELRSVRECRSCVHLGELLHLEPAICCGGKKTKHKIFDCAVHGECQLGQVVAGVACCVKCEHFQSRRC